MYGLNYNRLRVHNAGDLLFYLEIGYIENKSCFILRSLGKVVFIFMSKTSYGS
jgi:hypothetical protein